MVCIMLLLIHYLQVARTLKVTVLVPGQFTANDAGTL